MIESVFDLEIVMMHQVRSNKFISLIEDESGCLIEAQQKKGNMVAKISAKPCEHQENQQR